MDAIRDRRFFREYDLVEARRQTSSKHPFSHQAKALERLHAWYDSNRDSGAGGILVLPTGGGKTFTAVRFLTAGPLSDGYKVLWLAHTHHLLEQAFKAFKEGAAHIAEPKRSMTVRVVSGTPGHFRVHQMQRSDDVVVATLQTICRAREREHPALKAFLKAADGKLCVVFDEAHHAPAFTYRKLLQELRKACSGMVLLGLTATPTHTDERKRGWLKKLFPQGFLYQATAQQLMAARILAKPIHEEPRTHVIPDFDEREYQKWVGTYQDIPEDIITQLAKNGRRNRLIADIYKDNKRKYKKTIIFADRWYQCEEISEFLLSRGVKVGTMYSHVDRAPRTPEARNKRNSDENARVLADFRAGKLDVLINVRMLAEGTDVPDVTSVFLTRPTTSQILVNQMVGRALRGPRCGGTENAYIVSFIDDWRQLINWAGYDPLREGEVLPEEMAERIRPPIHLISIELVQRLARQIDTGVNIAVDAYTKLLPLGWYRVEYMARAADSEDVETVRQLVLVFEDEAESYGQLIGELTGKRLKRLEGETVRMDDVKGQVEDWLDAFFPEATRRTSADLQNGVFGVARHIAQNGVAPTLFEFEARQLHDLDAIAEDHITRRLDLLTIDAVLRQEFNRVDRLWSSFYFTYDLFRSQYEACSSRIIRGLKGSSVSPVDPTPYTDEAAEGREPSAHEKLQVKERDNFRCVCCGCATKRSLQIDHIIPGYYGGGNLLNNLQTLCSTCNRLKDTITICFRDPQTDLRAPPTSFPGFKTPAKPNAGNPLHWEMFLRRTINFFYRCGAVQLIDIGKRGDRFYDWGIELRVGNDPEWLRPHLPGVLSRIREAKGRAGFGLPDTITVWGPDTKEVTYSCLSED